MAADGSLTVMIVDTAWNGRCGSSLRAMRDFMVVVPRFGSATVSETEVDSIVCNRILDGEEQYMVKWKPIIASNAFSWHYLDELSNCLELLQDYLEARRRERELARKRKRPHDEQRAYLHPSDPQSRSPSVLSSSSESTLITPKAARRENSLNCTVYQDGDFIRVRPVEESALSTDPIPTVEMKAIARRSSTLYASEKIRNAVLDRLQALGKPAIKLQNIRDDTAIPLRFRFIEECVLREGVTRMDPETIVGCERFCRPNMGKNIGCQLSRKCDCLEYASVDTARMTDEDRLRYERDPGDTWGLPKRFPYHTAAAERQGCLVDYYLRGRDPIYECNHRCNCGPNCNNRLVQNGRKIPLEIFRTKDRGWGLRCPQPIQKGQFIDTYRGEIITDEEASRREQIGGKDKESYLYTLDKFSEEDRDGGPPYVIDGEYMGGPTRFMNHSCDPNVLQYTVSYNKHDRKVYELAFFARRDIPRNEELTFDYLDNDGEDNEEGVGALTARDSSPAGSSTACRCGSAQCRQWLWT